MVNGRHINLCSWRPLTIPAPMLQSARRALFRYLSEVKRATTPRPYDFRDELMLWDFTEDGALTRWDCICDVDVHGHSTAALEPNGKGNGRQTLSMLLVVRLFCACRDWCCVPWFTEYPATGRPSC